MLLYYLRLLENTPMTFWFLMDFFFFNLRVKKETGRAPMGISLPPTPGAHSSWAWAGPAVGPGMQFGIPMWVQDVSP